VTVSPWFLAISGFVGCGLMFAGISGWCGMAKLLAVMPWNKQLNASRAAGFVLQRLSERRRDAP
jgi:hypothetical protein